MMSEPKPGPSAEAPPTPAGGAARLALSGRLHEFADMAIALRAELVAGGWDERSAEALVMTWFEHGSTYKGQV